MRVSPIWVSDADDRECALTAPPIYTMCPPSLSQSHFDLEADLNALSEKGIDHLRKDLGEMDADCLEALRSAVHENYPQFIRASQVGFLESGPL